MQAHLVGEGFLGESALEALGSDAAAELDGGWASPGSHPHSPRRCILYV